MDNSIYITLSRQMALFRDLEVSANNLANVNTTGYNASNLMFSEYLVKDNARKDAYLNDPLTYRDTTNGAMKVTGNALDVAINGRAYFPVQTPQGTRYTRSGNFQTDANGTLVTVEGYAVLGADGGQIAMPDNTINVAINGVGQVMADGNDVGQIGMMQFANEQAMTRLGNNLYTANEVPVQSDDARMVQGAIETSNVSAIGEMTRVMELSRNVGNTAKFIEAMYDLERKMGTTYARQSA
jgi:flagellar basal-body rod protein FlgF